MGAIFPISGFINNKINLNIAQKNTPIIIGHGINDSIVPPERSEEAYQQLSKQTSNVELIKYDAQHNIPIKMLTKISQIIEKIRLLSSFFTKKHTKILLNSVIRINLVIIIVLFLLNLDIFCLKYYIKCLHR